VLLGGAAVAAWWCRPLTVLLFGSAYETSGSILAALLFYIGLAWGRLPYTTALQATGNEKTVVWTTAVTAAMNIPLNLVLFNLYGLMGIAYSTIVVTLAGTLVFCVAGHRILVRQGHLVP
jgi:O-antigen/teichoic acid export membrane protein